MWRLESQRSSSVPPGPPSSVVSVTFPCWLCLGCAPRFRRLGFAICVLLGLGPAVSGAASLYTVVVVWIFASCFGLLFW